MKLSGHIRDHTCTSYTWPMTHGLSSEFLAIGEISFHNLSLIKVSLSPRLKL